MIGGSDGGMILWRVSATAAAAAIVCCCFVS